MLQRPVTVVIENVSPLVNGGRYPVKRLAGDSLEISADIFKDGHDVVSAVLKWRKEGATAWNEAPMECVDPWNRDRWKGHCAFSEIGAHEFTIEAWGDLWKSWQHEWHAKYAARQADLKSESLEGAALVENAARQAAQRKRKADAEWLTKTAKEMKAANPARVEELSHDRVLSEHLWTYSDRALSTEYVCSFADTREVFAPAARVPGGYPKVWVDRERAAFSAWYEFFPRSAEGKADSGSTFRGCVGRVEYAKAMGFDTIYFPPIHPIGVTARKGRNNSLTCEPGEPGVPYAIGNRNQKCPNGGGHKDVAPELGSLEDFRWLVAEIHARGMEVALDFALNCSPDHPYVHDHPDWFYHRPDGSIKYAENPPKKYQDVYPLNFYCDNWRELWSELTSIIEFWCEQGVRVFRVDNPHTKPVHFWEYLIGRVQSKWPDAIFLSEAFTRPKMMRALAKVGFTQSYTYFTWRNTKKGLTDYVNELAHSESREYMRGNFFPNTPDILPSYLQFGGRPAFHARALLTTTISPLYGIYSGFELGENAGIEKKDWNPAGDVRRFLELCDGDYKQLAREEYLDSEKYQFKGREWERTPDNLVQLFARLNAIRRENPALHRIENIRFVETGNEFIIAYSRSAPSNHLLVVVNLDAWRAQDAMVTVPLEQFGLHEQQVYTVEDLLTGERYRWQGRKNFVRLTPGQKAGHILRVWSAES